MTFFIFFNKFFVCEPHKYLLYKETNNDFNSSSLIATDFPQFILISWIGLKISTAIAKELRLLFR